MSEEYGSDFVTMIDDKGEEFTLEVVESIDYNGKTYTAFLPADVDENGEEVFDTIDDDDELEDVYNQFMRILFDDEDEETPKQ